MAYEVHAEIVATVLEVLATPGARVVPGDTLALLESMKMEIPVLAERGGTVDGVHVRVGQLVREGEAMVSIGD